MVSRGAETRFIRKSVDFGSYLLGLGLGWAIDVFSAGVEVFVGGLVVLGGALEQLLLEQVVRHHQSIAISFRTIINRLRVATRLDIGI